MALDAAANFCYGTVLTAPSPATSGTSMVVTLLGGCTLPTVPFNCTVWLTGVGPLQSNAEIVRVTNYSMAGADATLTITRAQESTSARTVVVGDQFALTITALLVASLSNVTNDAQTKAAIVPNTAPSAGEILIGNAGNTAYAKNAVTGAITLSSAGATTVKVELSYALSDETTALTTGLKLTWRMPFPMTLTALPRLSVADAPTGSTLIVNVKESGTTIFSTKPSIDASTKTSVGAGTPAVLSDSALADDAEMTAYVDQIGASVAGAGLKLTLIGIRS